jgi:hypothetical protein
VSVIAGIRECRCPPSCECGREVEHCPQCACLHCCGWQSSHHPRLAKALEALERLPEPEPERGPFVPRQPEAIGRVHQFRRAARTIWRSTKLSEEQRGAKLGDLNRLARQEELPEWCCRAILAEIEGDISIGEGPSLPGFPLGPDPREVALRQLLSLGYDTCPTCRGWVSWHEVDRIVKARRRRIEELERRTNAIFDEPLDG